MNNLFIESTISNEEELVENSEHLESLSPKRPPTPKKIDTLFLKWEKDKGGEYPASLLFMDFNRRELINNFKSKGKDFLS